MIGPEIIADLHSRLAQRISERPDIPPLDPLPTTPWIAMSLLQKAIRRGHTNRALQAAATLLTDSPDRLWRRCGGIAFEDIGAADPDTVGLVTSALAGKRVRASLGGEWAVASFIVTAMAEAPKCRGADDLLMSVELLPDLREERRRQATLSIQRLRRIVLSTVTLHERALALWYILGTEQRLSRHLIARRGEPAFVFDLLDELGTPMTMVEIAREGFRRTREVLCPFVGLLMADGMPAASSVADDLLPPETQIGSVSSWALDIYTREGRAALHRFSVGDTATAAWVRHRVPQPRQIEFLGGLVFRVEGGLLARRMHWRTGYELRCSYDLECLGLSSAEAADLLALMRADIPQLNLIRAEVMGSVSHAR